MPYFFIRIFSEPFGRQKSSSNDADIVLTGLASRCWENMILAMLGEQFMVGEEICGAVVSVRHQVRCIMTSAFRCVHAFL